MKILITGIAGTGKSTIIKALNERRIIAIDLHDIPDLFFWQNKETGEKIDYAPIQSLEWFNSIDRFCDIDMLNGILNQYDNVVVAGTTSGNQKDFLSLFDKIILLQCEPQILTQRLKIRTNKSEYGKTKAEQEDNIEWQKEFDPLLISQGAIPVNTEGNLDGILSRIIEIIKGN